MDNRLNSAILFRTAPVVFEVSAVLLFFHDTKTVVYLVFLDFLTCKKPEMILQWYHFRLRFILFVIIFEVVTSH